MCVSLYYDYGNGVKHHLFDHIVGVDGITTHGWYTLLAECRILKLYLKINYSHSLLSG